MILSFENELQQKFRQFWLSYPTVGAIFSERTKAPFAIEMQRMKERKALFILFLHRCKLNMNNRMPHKSKTLKGKLILSDTENR